MPDARIDIIKQSKRIKSQDDSGSDQSTQARLEGAYNRVRDLMKVAFTPRTAMPAPANDKQGTFGQLAEAWMSHKSVRVKHSTCVRYQESLKIHILPWFGNRPLRSLTAEQFDEFAKTKLKSGRMDGKGGLSSKTVRDLLTIVRSVLSFARGLGCEVNHFTISYPNHSQKEMRVFTKSEQKALEQVLLRGMNQYTLGILLCLYTGLRLGELCALQWQDISLRERIIHIKKTAQRVKNPNEQGEKTRIVISMPKTKAANRQVPLPAFLVTHLRQRAEEGGLFVVSAMPGKPADLRTVQNYFKRYVKDARIADANFHALRHTFATRCVEAGVDAKSLSEILGHASVSITLSQYVHSSMAQKKKCVDQLVKYMNS